MKLTAPVLLLAMLAPAQAQQIKDTLDISRFKNMNLDHGPVEYIPFPKIITLQGPDKEVVGTAVFHGRDAYIRNNKGEHYQTVTLNPDGSQTVYDPEGKFIKTSPPGSSK